MVSISFARVILFSFHILSLHCLPSAYHLSLNFSVPLSRSHCFERGAPRHVHCQQNIIYCIWKWGPFFSWNRHLLNFWVSGKGTFGKVWTEGHTMEYLSTQIEARYVEKRIVVEDHLQACAGGLCFWHWLLASASDSPQLYSIDRGKILFQWNWAGSYCFVQEVL